MKKDKPTIELKPHSYQPSKAEKEEVVSYDCTVDEAANALFQQVIVKKEGVG